MSKWCNRLLLWVAKLFRRLKENENSMNHRGKVWIDLTPIGGEPVLCDCEIFVGPQGQIDDFQAVIRNLGVDDFNRLFNEGGLTWDEQTSGELDDGRRFEAQIGSISSYSPTGPDSMLIKGSLSNVSFADTPNEVPHQWVFHLSNLKLRLGDMWSNYPDEMRGSLDSIEFTAAGRVWRLTDTWSHKWKDTPKAELTRPVLSGLLTTGYQNGDSDKELTNVVQDISHVLAVATSRSVNWMSYSLRAADGTSILGYSRAAWVTAFNKHGFDPVNNHQPGSLKSLLEQALPIIASDRDWYTKTLGMLIHAQIAEMLDVRCSILYTLSDRISSYLVKQTGKAEIDPELKARARKSEFIQELHAVLQKLSPTSWTDDHTNAVLTEIKRWNSMPSFVTKIQRACDKVGLPIPDKSLLRPRNDLLHDGELTSEDDDNVRQYLELDWVVLAMVLRLFGYEGAYYHPKFGSHPVVLKDQMVEQSFDAAVTE